MSKIRGRDLAGDGKRMPSRDTRIPGTVLEGWGDKKITFVPDSRTPEEVVAADRARWREHRIWEIPQGFSLVPNGRAGTIYFRRDQKIIELGAELAGATYLDIVVFDDGIKEWIDVNTLVSEAISTDEQRAIRNALIDWLTKRGLKFSLGGVVVTRR